MAGKGVTYIKWRKPSGRCFMTALSSALLEWLLIMMLLINGIFAYMITWFARYCELPIPCLLCSRLDHVFGTQRMRSYWDLMCKSHKSEISSLVLCTHHDKLVDVHGMCENCLFSFATKDKSNSETYRLLVGKLGLDDDQKPHSCGIKVCCCCNEPWSLRNNAQTLLKTKSVELEKGDVDASLTREMRLNWNSSKETKRPSFLASISAVNETFEDCSPHFGYSELKLNSDTESEDHTFDTYHPQKYLVADFMQTEPQEQSQSDTIPEESLAPDASFLEPLNLIDDWMKSKDAVPVPEVSALKHPNLIDHELPHSELTESNEAPSALRATVGHGLEELNWQDIDLKADSSPSTDSISTNNVSESPNAEDIDLKADSSPSTDSISANNVPESPNAEDIQADPPKEEVEKTPESVNEAEKEHANPEVLDSKTNNDVQPANSLDLGDAYKLAVSSRGRQLSGKTLEQFLGKDSTRVSEDLKLLLAQLTGMISPRKSGNMEDSRALDALASIGIQILHKRISLERNDSRNSLERNESGFESLDLSTVSEIEGESAMERLKRQVEQDKKLMSALCKELEEERNASAVAANQALAMITRLQEEKAAMQMEALHDIRMMEEQAEFDVEALERANDLLADKEKEIQDLEAELDYYRMNYPDVEEEPLKESSWLGFDDERLYISQRLGNLETKLHLFSNSGIYQDLGNMEGSELESEKDDSELGRRRSFVRRAHSLKTPKSIGKDSLVHAEADMVTLGFEVSTLNERLQALEADRNFLEHAINSLRGGEEGVRFIQEIATHLRELRRVGIKRKQSLA